MSGAKFKYIMVYCLCFTFMHATVWHVSAGPPSVKVNALNYALHPAEFPDTLCLLSLWSPIYSGFGIQEGMIYGGGRGFDLSLKTQYHRLMSNHMLTVGFPILTEDQIYAGLQFHYTLSALHGVDTQHKVSCSGGMCLKPHPNWDISLYSMHLLSFPRDSTEHLLEASSGCKITYSILPQLQIFGTAQKRASLPWQTYFGVHYKPWKILNCALEYEISEHQLECIINICPGRWQFGMSLNVHALLGMSQHIMIAYVY
jgi:hypothetical protein